MKIRLFIVLCCMSFYMMALAQASGGQIKRNVHTSSDYTRKSKTSRVAKLNGYHEKAYPDGSSYKGSYQNDRFDGYGELIYKNRS